MKKMNKYNLIKPILVCSFAVFSFTGCSSDFLTVPADGQAVTSNYYKSEAEAYSGLVAVYDILGKNSVGFENMITMMNAGSDDHYAGGGGETDGLGIQSFSNYTENANTMPSSFWDSHYQGIFRANILLQKLPLVPMDAAKIARFTAEAKTLRALYYFNLVRMFGNIPLILSPLDAADIYKPTQVDPKEVYKQIEKDLTEAMGDLPIISPDSGRLSQGAAKALLGKVYLYDGKPALSASQLAEVNGTPGGTSKYGYKLLSNFSDLWVVANKFNTESILEVAHTKTGNSSFEFWGQGQDEGNSVNQMVGARGYVKVTANAPDLPSGWSFNVFTQNFYDFIKGDPRFKATVLDLKTLSASGDCKYIPGYQDTGYFLNKFAPRTSDKTDGLGAVELNYQQDTYIIRLADTYLLEAEALGCTGARAQALLDAVRARVGLPSVPVSLPAIKKERRAELAGEGHRFFDLVRWGDAATVLASRGFKAGKNEIFPIPYSELQNTKLKQNPNY
jgi:hypothetical protein